MKVIDQNIPSLLLKKYTGFATIATLIRSNLYLRRRNKWKMPKLGKYAKLHPSYEHFKAQCSENQRVVRAVWIQCKNCFKLQPETGGVEPPAVGYRNRSWWYEQAQAENMWYYNYFMRETFNLYKVGTEPPWCRVANLILWLTDSGNPDEHWNDMPDVDIGEYDPGSWTRLWIKKPLDFINFNLYLLGTAIEFEPGDILGIKVYKSFQSWTSAQPSWNDGPFDVELLETREYTSASQLTEKWEQWWIPACYSIMIDVEWIAGEENYLPVIQVVADSPEDETKIPYWSN